MGEHAASFELPGAYVLDLNGSLAVPHAMELPAPWNLPSRLFQFPIEVSAADAQGLRRYGLMHPLMGDHPFVRLVEARLGIQLNPQGAPNAFGYSKARTAMWWHAVDLVIAGKWRELLETRRFTTPEDIAGAVAFGLGSSPHDRAEQNGYLTVADARAIMAELGSLEPADRARALRQLQAPSAFTDEKKMRRCPVNAGSPDPYANAWAKILGLGAGWLKHNASGFLEWTEIGCAVYRASDAVTFTETATGQGAFAF